MFPSDGNGATDRDASGSDDFPNIHVAQFQTLLQEFLCVSGHEHGSRHIMIPNPSVNKNRRGPVGKSCGDLANRAYRGVTKHRKTGKYESHIWKQGKQLYCGAFARAADAAKAHDIISLRLRKADAVTNFLPSCYEKLRPALGRLTEDEVIKCLRDCAQGGHEAARKKARVAYGRDFPRVPRNGTPAKDGRTSSLSSSFELQRCYSDGAVAYDRQSGLFPVVPLQDVRQSTPPELCATSSFPDLSPLLRRQTDATAWSCPPLDISCTQPFHFVEGHVVDCDDAPRGNELPIDGSNGSSSDQEMQAVLRSVSLHDEFELQRQIDDGLVGFDPDVDPHFF